jgi:hypothetical protein
MVLQISSATTANLGEKVTYIHVHGQKPKEICTRNTQALSRPEIQTKD